jgi:shikimate kinase
VHEPELTPRQLRDDDGRLRAAVFVPGPATYTVPMNAPSAPPAGPSPSIFLVGPMGSGKSAVGKALARMRGLTFVDSDAEIERRTGVDIAFIFEKEGEAGFRQREREVISDLTLLPGIVLATGGGAILLPENRAWLATRGIVVYLEASVAQQVERTQHGRHRPLLVNTDPATRLAELMQHREVLYRSIAQLTVPTDRRKVQTVAEQIAAGLDALASRGAASPE